jgi:hypothetical protein
VAALAVKRKPTQAARMVFFIKMSRSLYQERSTGDAVG